MINELIKLVVKNEYPNAVIKAEKVMGGECYTNIQINGKKTASISLARYNFEDTFVILKVMNKIKRAYVIDIHTGIKEIQNIVKTVQ